jgi:Ca-activated chloride channel family protein
MSLNDVNANAKGKLKTTPNPIPDVYAGEPLFLSYQVTGEQSGSLLSGIYQGKMWSVNIEDYQQENSDNDVLGDVLGNVLDTVSGDALGANESSQTLLAKTNTDQNIPPLATLWARRKIADHYRQLMLYKDVKAKANIIELAFKYHLVTPFTSLVAVEKKASRVSDKTANAKQLTNMLPAGQKLPSTALNWQWQFNGALCLLVMSVISVISLLLLPRRGKNV